MIDYPYCMLPSSSPISIPQWSGYQYQTDNYTFPPSPRFYDYEPDEELNGLKCYGHQNTNTGYQSPYYPDLTPQQIQTRLIENWGHQTAHGTQTSPSCAQMEIADMQLYRGRESPSPVAVTGRRNLSKLLHKGYNFDKTQYLLLYTFSQLIDDSCNDITWVDRQKGVFFINNQEMFAKKWGEYKGKGEMNYQKVSRSFRYYYKQKNLLKKVEGKLRQYKWDLEALRSLEQIFNSGTPLRLQKTIKRKKSECN